MKGKLAGKTAIQYEHEKVIIAYFLEKGYDVKILPQSTMVGEKNADFIMNGLVWEAKSPVSNNCKTLIVTMRRATKQSLNVIVDLRRVKGSDYKMKSELRKYFVEVKKLRNLLVIDKKGQLIRYKR